MEIQQVHMGVCKYLTMENYPAKTHVQPSTKAIYTGYTKRNQQTPTQQSYIHPTTHKTQMAGWQTATDFCRKKHPELYFQI